MLDSLLTLTKRGAFWLAIAWLVAILLDRGVTALIGQQEPFFLLAALFIPIAFIVSATYTLAKRILRRAHRSSAPPS